MDIYSLFKDVPGFTPYNSNSDPSWDYFEDTSKAYVTISNPNINWLLIVQYGNVANQRAMKGWR
jgi:hypothetical protein